MDGMNEKFEQLIQGMLERDYGTIENFISPSLVLRLKSNLIQRLGDGRMAQGGVGQHTDFQENSQVRRDHISWIEDDQSNQDEETYHRLIWDFIRYLNLTCYTGLNAFESHYAWYDKGSFYKRHRDQFKSDSGRKYSIVLYLNDFWTEEDGGQLVMYPDDSQVQINPEGGRIVFFQSNIVEHEVLPAVKPRMSIAGWMKRV